MSTSQQAREGIVIALRKRIKLYYGNSTDLHRRALEQFTKGGRGAYFTSASNFGDLIHDKAPPAVFLTQKMVADIEYDEAIKHVRDYDPHQQFVIIASVVLCNQRRAARLNQPDSLLLSMILPKDAFKLVGGLSEEPLKTLAMMPDKHVCVCCGTRTTQKCSACECVSYCSPDHQRAHWPTHKIECRKLAAFKKKSRELLLPAQPAR